MKIFRSSTVLILILSLTAFVAQAGAQEKKDKGDAPKEKVHEVGKGLVLGSMLNDKDKKDTVRKDMFAKVFLVKLVKGKSYQIDMMSMAFDSYLRLEDSKSKQLAEDDDSGGNVDARIEFTATEDGVYRVIATSFDEGETGPFTLRIVEK